MQPMKGKRCKVTFYDRFCENVFEIIEHCGFFFLLGMMEVFLQLCVLLLVAAAESSHRYF